MNPYRKILNFLVFALCLSTSFSALAAEPSASAPVLEQVPSETAPETQTTQAVAPATKSTHFTLEKGGFFQAGGMLGAELNNLSGLVGGVTTAIGYQINSYVGLYIRSDAFAILDSNETHIGFTAIPSARFTIFDNLYGFLGVGYALTYAPVGSKISGAAEAISYSYQSATFESGLGYVYLFKKSLGVFAEGGFNYTHVERGDFVQTKFLRPMARAGLSLQF